MPDVQKRKDPVRPAHGLEDLARLRDPVERARAAVAFIAYAEARAKQARDIRDEAVRAAHASGLSKPEVGRRTGITLATVKAVTR